MKERLPRLMREILEKGSRGRAFRRRLPASVGGGPVWVTPEAGLRFWRPGLAASDPDLLLAARRFVRPGDMVWDIGANVGLFTFAAAGRAGARGRILAVEADTFLTSLLRRSARVRWPGRAPVEVICAAAGGAMGVAQFEIAARARSSNSLSGYGLCQKGGVRERQSVVVITMDWLLEHCPRPPQVLKIDVEGAEHLVLSGAERLLAQSRPLILCEVASQQGAEVAALLQRHDYLFFDIAALADPAAMAHTVQTLEEMPFNIVACPVERHHDFFPASGR